MRMNRFESEHVSSSMRHLVIQGLIESQAFFLEWVGMGTQDDDDR